MRAKTCLIVLLLFSISAIAPSTRPSGLGAKVVAFCNEHLGEKVGNGQCSVLAWTALGHAGAKRRGKDAPNKGDYTWGELSLLVESTGRAPPEFKGGKPSDLRPGDIVQLRDAKFVHHNGRRTSWLSFHHHTAVVVAIEDEGATVHVLQQNVNPAQTVVKGTYRLNDLTTGWLRFYHPVPKKGKEADAEPEPTD